MLIKKIVLFLLLAAFLPINAQIAPEGKLDGLWLFKGQTLQGNAFQPVPEELKMYKVFLDEQYIQFMTGEEGASIMGKGSIRFDNDSTFTETAFHFGDPYRKSKETQIFFRLKDKYLYAKFYIERVHLDKIIRLDYEEVWEKQEEVKALKEDVRKL